MPDIKFTPENILVEGRLGVNQSAPQRDLQVNGSEIHSGGPVGGISFSGRGKDFVETPTEGERWVWYSSNGEARLWSGKDHITINKHGQLDGYITGSVQPFKLLGRTRGLLSPGGQPSVWVVAQDIILSKTTWNPATQKNEKYPEDTLPPLNYALSHMPGDTLVINRGAGYSGGVQIEGTVKVAAKLEVSGTDVMSEINKLRAELEDLKKKVK